MGSRRWSLPPWHHDGGNSLYIQIWSAGSVNLDKLYNLIEEFVEKSILTYALEEDFLLRKDGPLGSDMKFYIRHIRLVSLICFNGHPKGLCRLGKADNNSGTC